MNLPGGPTPRFPDRGTLFLLAVVSLALLAPAAPAQESPDSPLTVEDIPEGLVLIMEQATAPRTGDLAAIREAKVLRVLTTYSRTNFFIGKGQIRGFEYEMLRDYERHLNKGVSRRELRTSLVFIPVAKDQLIPFLLEGRGDIAAAGLTVTPLRKAQAAFTRPYLPDVNEIVVTSRDVSGLDSLESLSGRTVHVVMASSYAQHLRILNDRLLRDGLPPVEVVEADPHLETEDLLELANAGVIDIVVADSHLAEIWSEVLPGIVLYPELQVNTGGELAWAVREDNPDLLADLNGYLKGRRKGTETGNILFRRYFEKTGWVRNPLTEVGVERVQILIELFRKYGERYDLDWLAIAALAYQESGLNQNLKSKVGAVGIMQVLPRTAADMGIHNVENLENNIHAGAKYLAWIRDRYFTDPGLDRITRADFVLASYNAGPNKISRLREKAPSLGYDPDRWSGNMELVVLRYVGQEPVRYVSNIHKYYLAFAQAGEKIERRMMERKALEGGR